MTQWEKTHNAYENKAYRIIRKHIKRMINKLPLQNVTYATANATVRLNLNEKDFFDMYYQIYKTIGLLHGKQTVRDIQAQIKTISVFETDFINGLQKWMGENLGLRIGSVMETFILEIVKTIQGAYTENLSVQDIQRLIYKLINRPDFYRYQAMRIARTETTTVSNYAALMAAKQSKVILDKVWKSIPDNRTRTRPDDAFDHRGMNGVSIGLDDKFDVNGNEIDYPGDQVHGVAGNIINCRCTMAFIPRKDINGFLIFK